MSISKKFYSFVLALIAVFALIGCGQQVTPPEQPEPIDGITLSDAQALVNKAMDKIGWTEQDLTVVGDLTFATSNSFAPGVTISWESDNTEVIALDGKVTRPVYGQGNATVVVTATYSISYNLDDEGNVVDEVYSATESWTFTVVEAGEVFNLAKLEAQLVAGEIATGTEVTFTGVIVAKMASNQGNQIFVHDGSAGIYVFTASDLTVGTEVQVSGTADIYYEIFQVKNAGITVVSENATLPEAQKTTLGAHMALGKDSGKIGGELINVDVLLEIVTEQYTNVYITDPKTGDKARIYYKTEYTYIPGYNNETDYIAALQPYNGKTINITLVQYDIKDGEGHRLMLTSYPITEVQAQELTDDEKAQFILNGVSLEDSYLKTFTLPTADGLTWAVKEGTGIEIVDGQAVVTRAEADQTVVLTATATVNEAVATKDFTVVIPLVEATVEGVVELTLSSLELASNSYASSTATVNGVTIQFVELGNYAAGIQMRNKEADGGNRSQIWNTVAFSGAIEKIEMVYNSTKKTYDNANCMIYSFGTEAGSLTHTVNFSTVAGQTTYTVTPGGAFTFFKLEINPSYTYSMYWDSITIYLGEGSDAPVEPEVPTHTHVACPTCGLCTAEDCDGAAEVKCQGHEVVTPEATWQVVANFEAGVAYKLGFYQTQKAATYYATGAMSGYYGATTTVAEDAADAYLVVVEGGYLIKVVAGSDVKYVAYQVSGTHHNFVYVTDEASASVFTYDAELATFVTTDGTNTVFMGTYGSYNTFGMSLVSKASTSYCANLYALVGGTETPDTPVEPEVPAHEHVACPTCGLCTAEDCDGEESVKCQGHEVVEPETPVVSGGKDDFNTVAHNSSYLDRTTTAGWTATFAAVNAGAVNPETNANPVFGFLGDENTRAFTIAGGTDKIGTIKSPLLSGGLSKLTFKYTNLFTDTKISVTLNIKDAAGNVLATEVFGYDNPDKAKYEIRLAEYTFAVEGEFVIEFVNNCPNGIVGNKDRATIWNIEWVGAAASETPDTPVEPEVPAHEHVACPTCGLCTAADCDGAAEVKCAGHVVEPEVPAHEHVACPTCQLCTAEDCDGEESVKCQGHEVVEPETPVVPAEITITFEGENRTEFSADKQVWSVDGLTITNAKAASTQPIADYVNPARFYANTSLTFESTANITKIVFTTTGGKNFSASQTVEGATINVDGTTTTITLDTPATSFTIAKIAAQVRVSQIVVYTE